MSGVNSQSSISERRRARRASTATVMVSALSAIVALVCVTGMIGIIVNPTGGFGIVTYPAGIALCMTRMIDPLVRAAGHGPHQTLSIILALVALVGAIITFTTGPNDFGLGYILPPIAIVLVIGSFIQYDIDAASRR